MTSSSRTTQAQRWWPSISSEYKNVELEASADQLSYPYAWEATDGPLIDGPVHVNFGCRITLSKFATMLGNCTIIYTPLSDVEFSVCSWINPGLTIIAAERSQSVKDKDGKPSTVGRKVTIGACSWIGNDVVIL